MHQTDTPTNVGSNAGLGAAADSLAVYRRLRALTFSAAAVLNAWDAALSRDGAMQEKMERLRDAMSA